MPAKTIPYEDVKAKVLSDPAVRKVYDKLEPGYQIAHWRLYRGLSQKALAGLVGTSQSSIARLENGKSEPTLRFLEKVVKALDCKVHITITEAPITVQAPK